MASAGSAQQEMIQHMEVRKVKYLISRVVKRVFSAVKVKYEKIIAISWQKITTAGETRAFEGRPEKNINEITKLHYIIIQTKQELTQRSRIAQNSTKISRADCQLLQQMRREREDARLAADKDKLIYYIN